MHRPQQIELADGGELLVWPQWLPAAASWNLFHELHGAPFWEQRTLKMFGKVIPEPRLSAWIGDPAAAYSYSGRVHQPMDWPASLAELRDRLQTSLDLRLNSVLANLYRGEKDSMGWHADDERELGRCPTIVSLSLGETRRFWLKHPNADTVRLRLGHGSLLVMRGTTQHYWKHCVPKETAPTAPRINLTFRNVQSVVATVNQFVPRCVHDNGRSKETEAR